MDKGREDCLQIFLAGVDAVNPLRMMDDIVGYEGKWLTIKDIRFNLNEIENIYVVGAGKASALMASAIESDLVKKISDSWVNVKYGHLVDTDKIHLHEAGHPLPDEAGIEGTKQILTIVKKATDKDLVICLLSGGGSSLLVFPVEGLTLGDIQLTNKILIECGATIGEINSIRKHISKVKGGRLAKVAEPASIVTLILSDVVGDPLDVVASGPTVPDPSTFDDCLEIVRKYNIGNIIPKNVIVYIQRGVRKEVPETPKPDDGFFRDNHHVIIGNNLLALETAKEEAEQLGYNSLILSSQIEGETRETAKFHAAILKEIVKNDYPAPKPACLISGGETTVAVKGNGLGGRNMEFVLALSMEIKNLKGVTVLSGGTDGNDGPTDAAGALADDQTVGRGIKEGLEPKLYLENNDSYHFFKSLGDLLITGPTNTNVMDIHIMVVN